VKTLKTHSAIKAKLLASALKRMPKGINLLLGRLYWGQQPLPEEQSIPFGALPAVPPQYDSPAFV